MKLVTTALLALTLTPSLALADGTDGVAQRLPFSDAPLGQQRTQDQEAHSAEPAADGKAKSKTPLAGSDLDPHVAAASRDLRRLERYMAHNLRLGPSGMLPPAAPQPISSRAVSLMELARSLIKSDRPDWPSVDATLDESWRLALEADELFTKQRERDQVRAEQIRLVDPLVRKVARTAAIDALQPAERAGLQDHPAYTALNEELTALGAELRIMNDLGPGETLDPARLERRLETVTQSALRLRTVETWQAVAPAFQGMRRLMPNEE